MALSTDSCEKHTQLSSRDVRGVSALFLLSLCDTTLQSHDMLSIQSLV